MTLQQQLEEDLSLQPGWVNVAAYRLWLQTGCDCASRALSRAVPSLPFLTLPQGVLQMPQQPTCPSRGCPCLSWECAHAGSAHIELARVQCLQQYTAPMTGLCAVPQKGSASAAAPLLSLPFHLKLFIYLGPVANAELNL